MGIATASEAQYENAVKKLFPQGEYWDKQFADPESDASLFCLAKTQEIIRFRKRMSDLFLESDYKTAVETIDDWERVLLGYMNVKLPLEERRNFLSTKKDSVINRIVIANVAKKYGLALTDIVFPFKPSFFGFSKFGSSIFSRPVFFSVIYIVIMINNEMTRNEAKERITKLLNNASFGHSRFGIGRFLGRSYLNKEYTSRVFLGIKTLEDFEWELSGKLLASNIAYYKYSL